ncbi:MAG: sugar transferase [Anaerolineae bacterium]|nr:sugar transferase [Anaerolineae bacterium]
MTTVDRGIVHLYAMMLRLYPCSFRTNFEEEMRIVFAETVAEAAVYGRMVLLAVCLQELRDWPGSLLREHWSELRKRAKEGMMGKMGYDGDVPGLVPADIDPVARRVAGTMAKYPGIKRAVDIVLAAAGLVVAAPLFALLVVLVKLDSPGSVFFRQKRVGKSGHLFTLFKFRSMVNGADKMDVMASGVKEGSTVGGDRHDSRLTSIGRIIRKLRVDELPQLVNVLKGEMSLLGPRPELPTR